MMPGPLDLDSATRIPSPHAIHAVGLNAIILATVMVSKALRIRPIIGAVPERAAILTPLAAAIRDVLVCPGVREIRAGTAVAVGLQLVTGLAQQLGGAVRFEDNEPGVRVCFEFPLP